tara:strand:+ start:2201 stop:3058 length:858 start_codon:yes stop_codon:yes gene_type:complete
MKGGSKLMQMSRRKKTPSVVEPTITYDPEGAALASRGLEIFEPGYIDPRAKQLAQPAPQEDIAQPSFMDSIYQKLGSTLSNINDRLKETTSIASTLQAVDEVSKAAGKAGKAQAKAEEIFARPNEDAKVDEIRKRSAESKQFLEGLKKQKAEAEKLKKELKKQEVAKPKPAPAKPKKEPAKPKAPVVPAMFIPRFGTAAEASEDIKLRVREGVPLPPKYFIEEYGTEIDLRANEELSRFVMTPEEMEFYKAQAELDRKIEDFKKNSQQFDTNLQDYKDNLRKFNQ